MGDRRGSKPGGTSLEALAVDKQARSGGSSSLELGCGIIWSSPGMVAVCGERYGEVKRSQVAGKQAVDLGRWLREATRAIQPLNGPGVLRCAALGSAELVL